MLRAPGSSTVDLGSKTMLIITLLYLLSLVSIFLRWKEAGEPRTKGSPVALPGETTVQFGQNLTRENLYRGSTRITASELSWSSSKGSFDTSYPMPSKAKAEWWIKGLSFPI